VLVPVDDRPRSARSLEIAGRIASQYDAHVVGLYVKPSTYMPSSILAEGEESSSKRCRQR
jgi:Universal stress protein family